MPYTTVLAGTAITASWANANVRDQAVTPFATVADRTSSIATPLAGMVSTLTTNTATEGPYVYNSAGQWALPWNLPWGRLASTSRTTGQTFSSTTFADFTGFTGVTVTTRARRRLRLTVCVPWYAGAANSQLVLNIVDVTGVTQIGQWAATAAAINDNQTITGVVEFTTSGTSREFKVQGKVAGAGQSGITNVTTSSPAWFTIDDVGPTGAPA